MRLYHERWEIESAFYALRHTLLRGRVLRSKDPAGIEQELWALLALYQALRIAMRDAAHLAALDPDRLSFTVALEAARDSVIRATGITDDPGAPPAAITRALLTRPLPPRRARFSTRKVKSPISRYHARTDTRPLSSTPITALHITVHPPDPAQGPARRKRTRPTRPTAPPQLSGRLPRVLHLLHTTPGQPWNATQIADALGDIDNLNSFRVQLSEWASKQRLRKTAPATYTTP